MPCIPYASSLGGGVCQRSSQTHLLATPWVWSIGLYIVYFVVFAIGISRNFHISTWWLVEKYFIKKFSKDHIYKLLNLHTYNNLHVHLIVIYGNLGFSQGTRQHFPKIIWAYRTSSFNVMIIGWDRHVGPWAVKGVIAYELTSRSSNHNALK